MMCTIKQRELNTSNSIARQQTSFTHGQEALFDAYGKNIGINFMFNIFSAKLVSIRKINTDLEYTVLAH